MAYVIGSQKGKDIAETMKAGESWTNPSDGSKWSKKSDGSVSVTTKDGQTHNNAYTSGGGGNSQYTQGNYSIGSDAGKQRAKTMGIGGEWIATDGSRWVKENDGTITVYHGGTKTNNAWTPSYYEPLQMSNAYLENYYQANPQPTAPQRDPRIDQILNEILNREDFSYDVMNDPLYQQYAQMYQREGDRAMRNTMAEAAASAGGMNTYAMTAAMQANNYYNSQLNDRIPELYQLAYNMYLNDKESKVQDLGILQNMDNTQYNRYRDTMNDWYKDKDFAYGMYYDALQQGNWQTQQDYNAMWDDKTWAENKADKEYDRNQHQSDLEYDRNKEDRATAEARVNNLIKYGEMPSDELIAQAGMDKAYVTQLVNAVRRDLGLFGSGSSVVTYSGSGGGSSGGSSKGGSSKSGSSGTSTTKTTTTTTKTENDNDWQKGLTQLGLGSVYSPSLLVELEQAGAITESNGKVKWTNGWNTSNYNDKLDVTKRWKPSLFL